MTGRSQIYDRTTLKCRSSDDVGGHAELPDRTCARLSLAQMLPDETGNPSKRARAPSGRRPWRVSRVFRSFVELSTRLRGKRYGSWFARICLYRVTATTPRLVARITTDDNDNTPQFRQFMSSRSVFRNIAQHGYLLPSFLSRRFATSRCANRIELWNSFLSIRVMWITCCGKRDIRSDIT